MLKNIVLLLAILIFFGCTQEQTPQTTSQSAPASTETTTANNDAKIANHLLVFFINPDGGPCKMQENILDQMSAELQGKVLIRPVKTTVSADMDLFYAYGIRALPTLLLADSSGKEISRLPPGVHAAETIRELLKQIPGA
ncbi:thioredoxin domain-containing protein [uncultured Desulfuromusa sp.]|uniref:thioredoxin family protein n=1 Tax=uncultured Desulfuromusa sp. TaxID=219183 RepID=UPI002AA90AC6|nr:thioredoxin domain-containing protein [uncultured Desulfuromusa sp.]